MNSPFASKKSVHVPTLKPHVLKLLSAHGGEGGPIPPIDPDTHAIDPRFNGMDLWDTFLHLHQKGEVCDLGFNLDDPARSEPGFYMARSKHLPKLSSNDPIYAVILNLENQWRIKWLRCLMEFLDTHVLHAVEEAEFAAHNLFDRLWRHDPSLVPQKNWRCRGFAYTRIENELAELFWFCPLVKHEGTSLGVRFGFARRPAGRGFTRTRLFECARER